MKTNRLFRGLFIFSLMFLAACGDDKEKEPEEPDYSSGEVSMIDGTHITAIGDVQYSYDNCGRCNKVSYQGEKLLSINYSNGTITIPSTTSIDLGAYKLSFTKEGYINSLTASFNGTVDGVKCVGDGVFNLSYNGDGLLQKITNTTKITATYQGESAKLNQTSDAAYTWSAGNLTKVVQTVNQTSVTPDGNESQNLNVDVEVQYGSQLNPFQQYTFGLGAYAMPSIFCYLSPVGLLGKGSKNLPTYAKVSGNVYNTSSSIEYTLNPNGSIATETLLGQTFRYSYEDVNVKSRAMTDASSQVIEKMLFDSFIRMGLRSLFK